MAMRGITWKRRDGAVLGQIDMKQARRIFESGKSFFIALENMCPDFAEEGFDKIVNAFLYYNKERNWEYRCRFYKVL